MSAFGWLNPVAAVVEGVTGGVLKPLLGLYTTSRNDDLAQFEAGAKADGANYAAFLSATVQMAQTRAAMNVWLGARLVSLVIGGLMTYHLAWVVADSTPTYGHVVGSFHVAALPHPLDDWEGQIVLSYFVVAPLAPIASALTARVLRR